MRKVIIILLIIIAAGGIYRWKFHNNTDEAKEPSAIDKLINQTTTGNTNTGGTTIDLDTSADGGRMYEGGGEYADYSEASVQAAMQAGKRVILVFEKQGDPTSAALHEDITVRQARIPKNTVIYFVNTDTNTALTNSLEVVYPNTIIYIGSKGQEIRRSGNGVITLAQVVNGIDDLANK